MIRGYHCYWKIMETIVDKYGVEYDIKQKILIKASPDLREEYIIHQNTEIIHPFAFMDCKKIKSIVLPDKLQYIGSGSFLGCSALKRIDIPDSVLQISSNTFSGCRELESVSLPQNLITIGGYAFCHCEHLHEVIIPQTVSAIKEHAFNTIAKSKNSRPKNKMCH